MIVLTLFISLHEPYKMIVRILFCSTCFAHGFERLYVYLWRRRSILACIGSSKIVLSVCIVIQVRDSDYSRCWYINSMLLYVFTSLVHVYVCFKYCYISSLETQYIRWRDRFPRVSIVFRHGATCNSPLIKRNWVWPQISAKIEKYRFSLLKCGIITELVNMSWKFCLLT